MFVAPVEPY